MKRIYDSTEKIEQEDEGCTTLGAAPIEVPTISETIALDSGTLEDNNNSRSSRIIVNKQPMEVYLNRSLSSISEKILSSPHSDNKKNNNHNYQRNLISKRKSRQEIN